ncbi:unnamed protein product [Closterium sp. NIES-54]
MAAAKRVLRYLCSTSGMGLVLEGRRPVVLTGHADASWADDQATQQSSQGYTFSLGSGSISWRSTRSSSVLSSSCEAEIYAGAMAAQELRWLTYLLTDLGEQPRSPPVLYVDNKAMLALCQEHRLEHRTKHIAFRYFLTRELQQRGQLRLAYMASEANTADIFTKALAPGDHQRFCTMLEEHRLLTKGSKCEFFQDRLYFFGHVISEAGVEIDPKKLDTVKAWHPSTNITELQSFLGFVNYVRRVVLDMAHLTAPQTDLLRKGVGFIWGEKEHAAFSALKNVLCSPPVLRIADPHHPFEVVTAVLLQDFGNGLQPIAYESQKLHPPEKNYPIHDRKMLAIVHAFKVWHCYLTGADVTVRTDHKSLQYLCAQPHLNPRQIRWLDFLESTFHYTVTYKKGASNIADALTRPTAQIHTIPLAKTSPLLTGLFTHSYQTDPFFTGGNSQQFATAKGVYYVKAGTDCIWVPGYTLLRELLLVEAHDGATSGDFGVEKTRQQLQWYY